MISAKILADSLSPQGHRLTTMEVVMPRMVLAEFNTHRMFSRNSASSRAIPFKKMVKMVQENPFIPLAWQKDHKGMQGTEYLTEPYDIEAANETWLEARDEAVKRASKLNYGNLVTKQLCNRLLEPFMYHKVIVTSSEKGLENFFKLRCPQYRMRNKQDDGFHYYKSKTDWLVANSEIWGDVSVDEYENRVGDFDSTNNLEWLKINDSQAEIHIQALAEAMWDVYNESTPQQLQPGEWHIPYMDMFDMTDLAVKEDTEDGTLERMQRKVAVARCARLSYQTLGDNPVIDIGKDLTLHDRLSSMEHWSPFEHIAKAMSDQEHHDWTKGEGFTDYGGTFSSNQVFNNKSRGWCRNFRGFIQYREFIDG